MRIAHSWFLVVAAACSPSAFAQSSWILSGEGNAPSIQGAEVLSNEPLFSASERKYLKELGQPTLAHSRLVTFTSQEQGMAWKAKLENPRSGGWVLELNERIRSFSTEPLESLQWALKNAGDPQPIARNRSTRIWVPGVAGEDIGLSRPSVPEESMDPSRQVIVAVLDTGIDAEHPDLKERVLRRPAECEALQKFKACAGPNREECQKEWANHDSDGNGYPLDCVGWNATGNKNALTDLVGDSETSDTRGHGTHVAGVIGAALNEYGIQGVSQNIRLLPVKVILNSPNSPVIPQDFQGLDEVNTASPEIPSPKESELKIPAGFIDRVGRGFLYAIRSGAQVINLSLGWTEAADSQFMRSMVELAQRRGIVVVTAAGNDSTEARIMPCLYPGVVCVGAYGPDGKLPYFSNFGPAVELAAPGQYILSTWPMKLRPDLFTEGRGFEFKSGTSMASPYVAGLVARMLNAGYSPTEAQARLLLGSRLMPEDSTGSEGDRRIRFGNADLSQAMQVAPQPLVQPVNKFMVDVVWNGKADRIQVPLKLKNSWRLAQAVKVEVQAQKARLKTSQWSLSSWEAGENREILLDLEIDPLRVPGDLRLSVSVQADGFARRTYPIFLNLVMPIDLVLDHAAVSTLPIEGQKPVEGSKLYSVKSLDGRNVQDYLAVDSGRENMLLQLLTEHAQGTSYRMSAAKVLPRVLGDIYALQRVDVNQDGKPDYVVIFLEERGEKEIFKFHFYDQELAELKAPLEYDNERAPMSERFQWLKILDQAGKPLLTPAWITVGLEPKLEEPAFDPWNPDRVSPRELRIYYIAEDGLRTVASPKDHLIVETLGASVEEQAQGVIPILLATGRDYKLEYYTATVRERQVQDVKPLTLPRYRMFAGTRTASEIHSLAHGSELLGTAFSAISYIGAQRATLLIREPELKITDHYLEPLRSVDSVGSVIGTFLGDKREGIFSMTHFEIQYHDLKTSKSAMTSRRRFSYLREIFSVQQFFPVRVRDGKNPGGDFIPGLFISEGLGTIRATEVIVPEYGEDGNLSGLNRPAKFHFQSTPQCRSISNTIRGSASNPTQLVFFCGDRFVRVALEY